jgi:hypothetical protein
LFIGFLPDPLSAVSYGQLVHREDAIMGAPRHVVKYEIGDFRRCAAAVMGMAMRQCVTYNWNA